MKYSLEEIKNNKNILITENINPELFLSSFDEIKITPFNVKEVIISFIIPSHNRYHMLKQTLQSIFNLKYKNIEVIVINDASSDERYLKLANEYKGFPIIFINNQNSIGPGLARKKGYNLSKGKYIIFIDDDDFYINDIFIEKALGKFKELNSLSFVSFNTITYFEKEKDILISKINVSGFIESKKYFLNFISKYQKPTSTFPTIFKKEKLDMADFKNMDMMNDASIYLRALTRGDAYIFDDYIGVYRVHNTNISKNIALDFIKENIIEKYNIYEMAQRTYNEKLNTWLLNQVNDTLRYFVVDSKGSFKNSLELIDFINKITNINKSELYKEYIKSIILKFIILFR